MNENLKKIHEYLIEMGLEEKELLYMDQHSVKLAMEICEYAHRNQKRENGEDYANHPARILQSYRDLVGIIEGDPFCIDVDLLYHYNVPFDGVQEVCLLHDVIEDTEFTLEDVRNIYVDCGFESFFDMYINSALQYITHDKSMEYEPYIEICLKNPISALVKMLDLQDNLRIIDLVELNHKNYDRSMRYVTYLYWIDSKYHFLENIQKYREDLATPKEEEEN